MAKKIVKIVKMAHKKMRKIKKGGNREKTGKKMTKKG